MAKEEDKVKLRPVDEGADDAARLYRLHKDAVEEIKELPVVRVGANFLSESRLETASRDELKTRSNEPGVASLIEGEKEELEKGWDVVAAGRKIPWGWIALVGCAFAMGILWSLVEVGRSRERRVELISEANSILEKEKEEEMEAEKTVESIERGVGNFFDSRSVEEMLRYVRQPERVRPLMEQYYSERPLKPTRVNGVSSLDALTIEYRGTFWIVSCDLEDLRDSQLLVEVEPSKMAKIDWETYVCYQPMDWDEFVRTGPADYTGDFRVYVEMDNYFTHEFSDSEVYDSFRLTALGAEEALYGFVDKRTAVAKQMRKLLEENGMRPTPMLLRLNVPGNMQAKRAAVIRQLVLPRWIFVDLPEVGQ